MSYEEYLQHSGILGMRWGRRNGPPYPLSRRNMSAEERKLNPKSSDPVDRPEEPQKPNTSKSVKVETSQGEKTVANSKPVKDMSDKELNDSINRMKKEKEYRELSQGDVTKGAAFVKALLIGTGALAVTTFATTYAKTVSENAARKSGNETSKIVGPKIESLFAKLASKNKKDNK